MSRSLGRAGLLLSFLLMGSGSVSLAFGATITVTTCADDEADGCDVGECTLREAIGEAEENVEADTIDFTSSLAVCTDGEIDLVGSGLQISTDLTVLGPGADDLAVDGGGSHRVFLVSGGVVVLEDLTVKGGETSGSSRHGAGIHNSGDLTLRRTVVTANHAFGSSSSFTDGGHGGGIYNDAAGTLVVEDSVVQGNTAGDSGTSDGSTNFLAGNGGGIYSRGDLTLRRSTVTGNDAGNSFDPNRTGGHGGGIFLADGTAEIAYSTLSDNRSGDGAPSFGGSIPAGRDGFGGGIHTSGSSAVTVVNSTFSGNATGVSTTGKAGDGGGLHLGGSSTVVLGNLTITANHADRDGGGMRTAGATVLIGNSIVAGNTGSSTKEDCSGLGSGSEGYNVVGIADGCSAFGETDQKGSSTFPLDPGLDVLADNGGPTETHLLLSGSPAIDKGDPGGCTYQDPVSMDDVPVTDDQRLVSRPQDRDYDGTAVCDVGAVELESEVFTVTVTLDGSGAVTSAPAGIDCGSTCSADFSGGTTVDLTGTPDTGQIFTGWSGSCTGDQNPCSLLVDETEAVTAGFAPGHHLTVTVEGSGTGSVTGPGIDCPGDCTEAIAEGTDVTLTATADSGSAFTGWSGDCSGDGDCQLTMSGDRAVKAAFEELVLVSVTVEGSGSGTVTSLDGGIDCGSDCQEQYPSGTPVDLTATPGMESAFVGWDGACSGFEGCSFAPTADAGVTATFLPLEIFDDDLESGTLEAWDLAFP